MTVVYAVVLLIVVALLIGAVVAVRREDSEADRKYDEWFESPERGWNQGHPQYEEDE